VRILVDVASDRLRAELVELLERAGHTIEHGEAALHARVHEAFATGARWSSIDMLVSRIYSDLFLMPTDDPALGLDVQDPFAA
jgi:hypothetical protein